MTDIGLIASITVRRCPLDFIVGVFPTRRDQKIHRVLKPKNFVILPRFFSSRWMGAGNQFFMASAISGTAVATRRDESPCGARLREDSAPRSARLSSQGTALVRPCSSLFWDVEQYLSPPSFPTARAGPTVLLDLGFPKRTFRRWGYGLEAVIEVSLWGATWQAPSYL